MSEDSPLSAPPLSAPATTEPVAVESDLPPLFSMSTKIALAAGIVFVDLLAFALPLTAIVVAWLIVVNPPWLRRFVDRL